MPRYDYFCNAGNHHNGCGYEWEEDLTIDDRCLPMSRPCPDCKKYGDICRKMNPITQVDPILVHGARDFEGTEAHRKINNIKKSNPKMKWDFN